MKVLYDYDEHYGRELKDLLEEERKKIYDPPR